MRVCVTGATGFVGAHIARLLCERGDEVQVTYRNPKRLGALTGLEVRPTRADVRDYGVLRRAFEGAEVVFHTVGYLRSQPTDWAWRGKPAGRPGGAGAAGAAGARPGAGSFATSRRRR